MPLRAPVGATDSFWQLTLGNLNRCDRRRYEGASDNSASPARPDAEERTFLGDIPLAMFT